MSATGLHHVTAFSGAPARNLDFYTRVLGLRLVKKTVNFDDPGTYHLYYGDETGRPGTILTFFPIPHAAPGRLGIGETRETAFRIPAASLGWWVHRLVAQGVRHETPEQVHGEPTLRFRDPDGMALALVGVEPGADMPAWASCDIAADHAVRGLHGVTLMVRETGPTAAILTDVLGLRERSRDGSSIRLTGSAELGAHVTLQGGGEAPPGRQGAGSVHHVAFRAADDTAQAMMAERLRQVHQLHVTEQRDRNYFRSVYFREPGGVLFEIATDSPGFAVDETVDQLGGSLKLPGALESRRAAIERSLPAID